MIVGSSPGASCRVVDLPAYERMSIPDEVLDCVHSRVVVLKPNISTRSPASYTHPAVIRALADALRRRGAEVIIGEGMHLTHFKQLVLKSTGYQALLADYSFVDLEKEPYAAVRTAHPALPEIAVPRILLRPDVSIVNVPKLKTHLMTFYTGPVKNISMGVVAQHSRALMHRLAGNDFHLLGELLVDAYLALRERVALTVVDAGEIMEGDGPTFGRGRWLGKLLCGPTVEVEWLCARLLGAERTPVPLALSRRRPMQAASLPALAAIGVRGPSTYGRSLLARLPAWTNVDYWASVVLGRVLISRAWHRVRIDERKCVACRTCLEHCPSGAIGPDLTIVDERCNRCLSCLENCPQQAIAVRTSRLMRLLNRVGGYVY